MGTDILVLSFNAESVILSRVQHSTQAAPYTHTRQNWLFYANRQRGIFRLHVGIEPGSLDPEPQLLTIAPYSRLTH